MDRVYIDRNAALAAALRSGEFVQGHTVLGILTFLAVVAVLGITLSVTLTRMSRRCPACGKQLTFVSRRGQRRVYHCRHCERGDRITFKGV